ncbi:hypothetical protein RB594_006483 [Gaeumannomyces avenae]
MAAQLGGDMMSFVQRYQILKQQQDSSDELIKDLLLYLKNVDENLRSENRSLQKGLHEARLDLDDARKSRRDFQAKLQEAEDLRDYYKQGAEIYRNRNQYVIVLIDGDGLLFKESFITQGVEGGKRAANFLRGAILQQCGELADELEVHAKVCANLSGLAKAMKREGSIQVETDLRDFFVGFSQAKASFDFVDVGHGKERADSKIREAARWHLRNVNCRQVVLGVSHDSGYAPFLDEVLRDEQSKNMITILEGFPTVRDIAATGVNRVNFTNDLFRSDKLVDRLPSNAPPPGLAGATSPTPINSVPGVSSYAGVTAVSASPPLPHAAPPPPTLNIPLAPKPSANASRGAKPPPWNPGPRGLDKPIQVNQAALDGIKKRKDQSKLCNNHYLRPPCQKGSACCFEHEYEPTKDERTAIAFLARLNPCTNGQDCDIGNCIYGHHCPSTINGQCQHPYCKFRPDEHPPGTKYKSTYRNGDSYDS